MANEKHPKMAITERAKQFMPFSVLRGLDEALREQEIPVVAKRELSEDALQELDQNIHQITPGNMVEVIYYAQGHYLRLTGMVAKLDTQARYLQIVNTKIPLKDIYALAKTQ